MVEGLGRSTSTRFLTKTASGAAGCGSAGCRRRTPGGRGPECCRVRDVRHRTTGTLPKAVTRSVTKTPWDGALPVGTDATLSPWRARRMVMGETYRMVWDGVRLAHNPEVAGSNPAPRLPTSSQVRGPFPLGEGLLPCVARDQIRDQIRDRGRLSRSAPSHSGTHCDWSGHLRCDHWVETRRSYLVRQPYR
jgi:hypothetical protein